MALQMLITTALLLLVCWTVWSGLYFAINHTFYQHQWSTHTTVHYFSLFSPQRTTFTTWKQHNINSTDNNCIDSLKFTLSVGTEHFRLCKYIFHCILISTWLEVHEARIFEFLHKCRQLSVFQVLDSSKIFFLYIPLTLIVSSLNLD